jgi:hypothetical protein
MSNAIFNARDKSRTSAGKRHNMVRKATQPPADQGGWIAETREFLESVSYRTLSINGRRVLDRLKIEHICHGRTQNGGLIVTHQHFIEYGVTPDLVGDGIDECAFKGLVKVRRGRAGNGTAHPNIYTLTFDGTEDGLAASNEWRTFTIQDAKRWTEEGRKGRIEKRAAVGRKQKAHLEKSKFAHSEKSKFVVIREAVG